MARARRKRAVAIDHGMCRCIGASPARVEALGYGRRFESSGVFFTAGELLQHEKSIGSDAQACMMMKATPISSFVMTKADFLLEFPVVALDEQPFFLTRAIGVRGAHPYPREARAQRSVGTFAPGDSAIAGARQALREF